MAFGAQAAPAYTPPSGDDLTAAQAQIIANTKREVAAKVTDTKPAGQYLAQRHFINRTEEINAKSEGDPDAGDAEFNDELQSFKRLGRDVTPVEGVRSSPKREIQWPKTLTDYWVGRNEGA